MQKFAWILVGLLAGLLIATSVPVTAHHNDRSLKRRINRLENQMAVQRQKTTYMDRDGFYLAPVSQYQVLSVDCQVGDDAIWVGDPMYDVRFLSCTEGSYPQGSRATESFLEKLGSR